MAMLWKVPLVFVCENNGIAISVPTSKSQATPDIADRARGFGMPAAIVDGNDVARGPAAVARGRRAAHGPAVARRSSNARPCAGSVTPRSRRAASDPGEQRAALAARRPDPAVPEVAARLGRRRDDAGLDQLDAEFRAEMRAVREEAEQRARSRPRVGLRGHLRAVARSRAARPAALARGPAGLEAATVSSVSRGRGRASMREVAERAGVAMSSVSRVLSGSSRREPGDEREGDAGGRRARLPAGHARPEPAPAGDAHGRVRRRRHLQPALRRDRRPASSRRCTRTATRCC